VRVKLDQVKAYVNVLSTFMRECLKGEHVPTFTIVMTKVGSSLKPWGPMVLPDVFSSMRAYYSEKGYGLDEGKNAELRRKKLRAHLSSRGASLHPATFSLRLSNHGQSAVAQTHTQRAQRRGLT
jgi:hypothetical protein